ncbi:Chitin synthase 7 [Zancudomyces culisetae]|uniref:chitin synthase n=1 Tax=Zancudomyces culisetae TaxID=1213189 RepID=A0A1R1PKK5_ZANCU|nr:Chitin synthase 7 [Zancudomyces culisetae]|eukprot:OMH81477.1 Chitin synthase 7 [Zancudomyces culisetae]
MVLCPDTQSQVQNNALMVGKTPGTVGILGQAYSTQNAKWPSTFNPKPGEDITNYFKRSAPNECQDPSIQKFRAVQYSTCETENGNGGCPLDELPKAIETYGLEPLGQPIGFDWEDVTQGSFTLNGAVVNLNPYLIATKNNPKSDLLDAVLLGAASKSGSDGTVYFMKSDDLKAAEKCILAKYKAGILAKQTVGCFGVQLYNYIALTIILGIILTRFCMALGFSYFISPNLTKRPARDRVRPISYNASAPWSGKGATTKGATKGVGKGESDELYTVMLVTCYSEGEDSIRGTCDSLVQTEYSSMRKLLFIVADGIIKGSGNTQTTPDICVGLIEQEEIFENPEPSLYLAVGSGSKQMNAAKVYCGYYRVGQHRVPTVVVVKCGADKEKNDPKPGNRGKRDSQIILMGFFSRVIYNDRLTPLDYDLFRKIHHLTGATPDLFEIVLMVDADTRVYPDSLRLLVNCLYNDHLIMGICGETKIANKRDSWVTAIQVYEYYISHHLGKGFESVFGGVTCLPGCFCMYRLKARKGQDWVPILVKPEIVQDYSQNVVTTLHEKNLMLLGEDRYLSTLMLRNFPNRKMMFMPQAICKTMVPDEFKVLLSQRRRWINSTVHNLMELVLVRGLCGTFCLSMQFSVFLDLIGTVSLPVAIMMTVVLIISVFKATYNGFSDYIPLIMLISILFMPAFLIVFTTKKWIYLMWMAIYLCSLPVWNFVLPVYAYWHFDDFSWGETRKVQGEVKGTDDGHGSGDGDFDPRMVPLRRWEDYERRRIRDMRNAKHAESRNGSYELEHSGDFASRTFDDEMAEGVSLLPSHTPAAPTYSRQPYQYGSNPNLYYQNQNQNQNEEFELQNMSYSSISRKQSQPHIQHQNEFQQQQNSQQFDYEYDPSMTYSNSNVYDQYSQSPAPQQQQQQQSHPAYLRSDSNSPSRPNKPAGARKLERR